MGIPNLGSPQPEIPKSTAAFLMGMCNIYHLDHSLKRAPSYNDVIHIVITQVRTLLNDNKGYTVVTVGHSMGGALASIAAMSLKDNLPATSNIKLYTYGWSHILKPCNSSQCHLYRTTSYWRWSLCEMGEQSNKMQASRCRWLHRVVLSYDWIVMLSFKACTRAFFLFLSCNSLRRQYVSQ